jgi:hypothetical protein
MKRFMIFAKIVTPILFLVWFVAGVGFFLVTLPLIVEQTIRFSDSSAGLFKWLANITPLFYIVTGLTILFYVAVIFIKWVVSNEKHP